MKGVFLLLIVIAGLAGCARDLVIELGEGTGDSIRMVGMGDNFRCDDPAFAHVRKARTFSMHFSDGVVEMCRDADAPPPKVSPPPVIRGTTNLR
jgi:hypothetical protein